MAHHVHECLELLCELTGKNIQEKVFDLIGFTEEQKKEMFVKVDEASEEELERMERLNVLIKEKHIPIVNVDLYKPGQVVAELQTKVPHVVTMTTHTAAWQHLGVRPRYGAQRPERTRSEYCVCHINAGCSRPIGLVEHSLFLSVRLDGQWPQYPVSGNSVSIARPGQRGENHRLCARGTWRSSPHLGLRPRQ